MSSDVLVAVVTQSTFFHRACGKLCGKPTKIPLKPAFLQGQRQIAHFLYKSFYCFFSVGYMLFQKPVGRFGSQPPIRTWAIESLVKNPERNLDLNMPRRSTKTLRLSILGARPIPHEGTCGEIRSLGNEVWRTKSDHRTPALCAARDHPGGSLAANVVKPPPKRPCVPRWDPGFPGHFDVGLYGSRT